MCWTQYIVFETWYLSQASHVALVKNFNHLGKISVGECAISAVQVILFWDIIGILVISTYLNQCQIGNEHVNTNIGISFQF